MKYLYFIFLSIIGFAAHAGTHTVQPGETFADIAKLYGITEDSLRNANPHTDALVGYALEVPIDGLFYDLGESSLFRKVKYLKSKGKIISKKISKAKNKINKNTSSKDLQKITTIFEEGVDEGNLDAIYILGRYMIHGNYNNMYHTPSFDDTIVDNVERFEKGLEYLQIVGLLDGNFKSYDTEQNIAYAELGMVCLNEKSPIYNPYLGASIFEWLYFTSGYDFTKILYDIFYSGIGVKKDLKKAYIYCYDTSIENGKSKLRTNILEEIEAIEGADGIRYGNGFDNETMFNLGMCNIKNDNLTQEGLYWLHRAARKGNYNASLAIAVFLKNEKISGKKYGLFSNKEKTMEYFLSMGEKNGHKESADYLYAYREEKRIKKLKEDTERYEKMRREQEKKDRRNAMWNSILQMSLQGLYQGLCAVQQTQMNIPYNQPFISPNTPYYNMSDQQIMGQHQLALQQIMNYSSNYVNSQWFGTPMPAVNMSAVNLGTDMTPGSPLWEWNVCQQLAPTNITYAKYTVEEMAYRQQQSDAAYQQWMNGVSNIQMPYFPTIDTRNMVFDEKIDLSNAGLSYWGSGYDLDNNESPISTDNEHSGHSHTRERIKNYYNRYGDKQCHACGGSGRCPTCGGSRIMNNHLGQGSSECPNCYLQGGRRTGLCSTCQGKGTVFGIR